MTPVTAFDVFSGLVKNTAHDYDQESSLAVAGFDARGNVLYGSGDYASSAPVGEKVSWSFDDWHRPDVNRYLVRAQQYGFECE